MIYIDFSKAFDVVLRDKLFTKLETYGIRGVVQWIKNLFCGRTFCTNINNLLPVMACFYLAVLLRKCYWATGVSY